MTFDPALRMSLVSVATFVALACSGTTFHETIAAGAVMSPPRGMGTCTGAVGAVRLRPDGRTEAIAPGVGRITCTDGDVVFDVRPIAAVAISPVPTAASGSRLVYRAIATDAHGIELGLGDEPPLTWTFSGALSARPYPGCGDVIPLCPRMSDGFAFAGEPGTGHVAATLGALHAAATTVVQ